MLENNDKQIVVYKSSDGLISFDVSIDTDDATVWLTQKQMATLFAKDVRTISEHIQNIYGEKELAEVSTIRNFQIVQKEGTRQVTRRVEHYNLDVILYVGYRVKSKRGTEFRQWATKVLKNYLLNGYAANTHKLQKIEDTLTLLVKKDQVHDTDILQIKEALSFIQKMLAPPPIIVNNNLSVSVNVETVAHKKDLEAQLQEIKNQLSDQKLRKLIEEQLANLKSVEKESARAGLAGFVKSLDDTNSQVAKSLTNAGVTISVLKKIVKLGLALINQLKL